MKRISLLQSTVVASITAVAVFFILSCQNSSAQPFELVSKSPLRSDSSMRSAVEMQGAFTKVFELYKSRVVFISTETVVKVRRHPFYDDPFFRDFFDERSIPESGKRTQSGLGSGFILSEDGYICTNHHVISNVDSVKVQIDGESYDATIVGSDERTDLALLKIEPKKKLDAVFMGDSDSVNVGDWAIAIGNPFGLDRSFTTGVVSATGRKDLDLMGKSQSHIQTDASINPGNSGGPLINIYGEVIGINRMIYSKSGGSMGIGFAIPINRAKEVLTQLQKHGKIKRGYIGVQIAPISQSTAAKLGLKSTDGALVGGVLANGPADLGGIKVGDVILKVNQTEIKDFSSLVESIEETKIGDKVKLLIWRNNKKMNLYVDVKERP